MASWSQTNGSTVQHARCPVHGAMVVQTLGKAWIWRCADCIAEACRAIRRIRIKAV